MPTQAGQQPDGEAKDQKQPLSAAVLPLRTQLPWYSHILWLPFALLCGPALAELVQSGRPRVVALLWLVLGIVLLPAGFLMPEFLAVLLPAGGALLIGGWGLRPASRLKVQAAIAMVGLWWLGLLLLFSGPLWHWELNEKPPVADAAALTQKADSTIPLALWGHGERPSLSWQSQRQLIPLARLGIPAGPVQLLSPAEAPIPEVADRHCDHQASSEDNWSLWICAPRP